jgi:hypothetical protein
MPMGRAGRDALMLLLGNPKLKALNPKQILISKFKTEPNSYQPSALY